MNFVIFPMFFASSALYPLWRIRESSPLLYEICRLNPFTYAVELLRFALYGQIGPRLEDGPLDLTNLYVCIGYAVFFLGAAIYAYNPSRGSSPDVAVPAARADHDDLQRPGPTRDKNMTSSRSTLSYAACRLRAACSGAGALFMGAFHGRQRAR